MPVIEPAFIVSPKRDYECPLCESSNVEEFSERVKHSGCCV